MLIDQIKTYVCAAIVISLLTVAAMTRWQLHSVTEEYNEYKDSINDQLQKAKDAKAKIEAEQNQRFDMARDSYNRDRNELSNRLRELEALSRKSGVRVARDSADSMSGKAEDTTRTSDAAAITARTGCPAFYTDAMMDTLQCSRLIEFVRP